MEQLSCDCVLCNTLKVPCIQLPVHCSKLEVAALLEEPLAVFQVLAIMEPAVADVSRIANFTAQHGTAPMQSILGFGLLGELDGISLDEQNQRQKVRERGKSEDQNVAAVSVLLLFPFIKCILWRPLCLSEECDVQTKLGSCELL